MSDSPEIHWEAALDGKARRVGRRRDVDGVTVSLSETHRHTTLSSQTRAHPSRDPPRRIEMTDADREPARDPQDLERLLVARQRSGDIEGALFEPGAIIHTDDGRVLLGHEAMRAYYLELAADGRIFVMGD